MGRTTQLPEDDETPLSSGAARAALIAAGQESSRAQEVAVATARHMLRREYRVRTRRMLTY